MSGYDNDNDDNDRGAKETSKRKEEERVRRTMMLDARKACPRGA